MARNNKWLWGTEMTVRPQGPARMMHEGSPWQPGGRKPKGNKANKQQPGVPWLLSGWVLTPPSSLQLGSSLWKPWGPGDSLGRLRGGSGVRSCEPELLHVSWVLSPRRNGCLVLNKCWRMGLKQLSFHDRLHLQCSSLFALCLPQYLLRFAHIISFAYSWYSLYFIDKGTVAQRCWVNCPGRHRKETGLERWPEMWEGPEHVGAFLFYFYHRAKQHHWEVLSLSRTKSHLHFEQDTLAAEWRMNDMEMSYKSNAVVQVRGDGKLRW